MNEDVAALAARPGVAPWRIRLATLVESDVVTRTVVVVILVNALLMGLETHKPLMASAGDTIHLLDKICLAVFVVELAAKLAAYGLQFWRNGWRNFDFFVVAVALVPGAGPWAVLRSLRVLRVLRLLTIVPSLRRVVAAFLHAIPGLLGVIAVMVIIFYTGGVLATTLYSESQPDFFGDLQTSLYSLFQIMTLDSWHSQIVRPMVTEDPSAGPFFLIFVVVTSFTVLNLFIGIIVTAMQEMADAEKEATAAKVAAKAKKDAEKETETGRGGSVVALSDIGASASNGSGDGGAAGGTGVDGTAVDGAAVDGAAISGTAVDGHTATAVLEDSSDVGAVIARMERDLATLRALHGRS